MLLFGAFQKEIYFFAILVLVVQFRKSLNDVMKRERERERKEKKKKAGSGK